jgi:hypothetical protein
VSQECVAEWWRSRKGDTPERHGLDSCAGSGPSNKGSLFYFGSAPLTSGLNCFQVSGAFIKTVTAERCAKSLEAISKVVSGDPDPKHISTSYIERQNLTLNDEQEIYEINQCIQQEPETPEGCGHAALCFLQILPSSSITQTDALHGSRNNRPRLGHRRTLPLKAYNSFIFIVHL